MGLAVLPDGTRIDYKEYIASHPHWQTVRRSRYAFDRGECAVCHKALDGQFETHHLNYQRLGNEHMRDVITLCSGCHVMFHNNWERAKYWKGREEGHWQVFSITHTARMCRAYYKEDKFICKDPDAPNLCNKEVAKEYLDRYMREFEIAAPVVIDPNDFSLFVRNKRYEMVFEAEARGLTVEEFLDECYGKKERGKNPLRQEAGKKNGAFDHTIRSFHSHYKENKNINKLMEEVKNGKT